MLYLTMIVRYSEGRESSSSLLVLTLQLAELGVRRVFLLLDGLADRPLNAQSGSSLDDRFPLGALPRVPWSEDLDPVRLSNRSEVHLDLAERLISLVCTDFQGALDPARDCGARQKLTIGSFVCLRDSVRDLLVRTGFGDVEELVPNEKGGECEQMLLVGFVGRRGRSSWTLVRVVRDGGTVRGGGGKLGPHVGGSV
jgi:hypothetical protein